MKYQFILSRIVIIIIKKIMSSVDEDMRGNWEFPRPLWWNVK